MTSNPEFPRAERLSRAEKEAWRSRLSQWQTPDQMLANVREAGIASEVFFRQAGLEFVRDAWIAGTFALGCRAARVRLVTGEWPDFETEDTDGNIHQFEAVEADLPGRKRGDEYAEVAERRRRGESVWRGFTPGDAERGNKQVEQALRRAAERKANKSYAARCNLIMLLNFGGEFGWGASDVRAVLHSGTKLAREAFEEVWVLWQGRGYLLWRVGHCVDQEHT